MLKRIFSNGLMMCFLSAFFFAVMSIGVRIAGKKFQIDGTVAVLGRFIVGVVLCWILIRWLKASLLGTRKALLLLRGVLAGTASIFGFIAMGTPSFGLAKAVTLQYSSPVWALIFAWFFLREKIRLADIALLLMTFCGVALVLEVDFTAYALGKAEWAALGSAFFGGAALSTIKPLRKTENIGTIYLYYCFIGAIFSLFFLPGKMPEISGLALGLIAGIGVFAFLGQMFLVYGLKYCRLLDANISLLMTPVISAGLAFLLFGERLGSKFWIGCLLVLISGALTAYLQHKTQVVPPETPNESSAPILK